MMIRPIDNSLWMRYAVPTLCDPDLEPGRGWTREFQECPEGTARVVGGGEITGTASLSLQRLGLERGGSPACRVPSRSRPHGPGAPIAMGTIGNVSGAGVLDRVGLSIRGGRREGPSQNRQTPCRSRRTQALVRASNGVVCVFGAGHLTAAGFWQQLDRCGVATLGILKVQRVTCRFTQVIRYDIYTQGPDAARNVMGKLRAERGLSRWHVKLSVPYSQRRRRTTPTDGGPMRPDTRHHIFATLNINGLKSKRSEVDLILRERKWGILGLQETKMFQGCWPARYQGFTSFSAFGTDQPGERGLATFVNKSFRAFELNHSNPSHVFIQFFPPGRGAWIHGNVYIPHRGLPEARSKVLETLQRTIRTLSDKRLPIIIGGDFNTKTQTLRKWIHRHCPDFEILTIRGSALTFHSKVGKGKSDIDHFLVNTLAKAELTHGKVERTCDASDHWPVTCKLRKIGDGQNTNEAQRQVEPAAPKLDATRLQRVRRTFLSHNYWEALANLSDTTSTDEAFHAFIDTSKKIARESGVMSVRPPPRPNSGPRISPKARRLINRRRQAWAIVRRTDPKSRQGKTAWEEYQKLSERAQEAVRVSDYKARQRLAKKGSELLRDKQMKKWWRHQLSLTGNGKHNRDSAVQPLMDQDGNLQTDTCKLLQIWEAHFKKVFHDESGTSKDPTAWMAARQTLKVWPPMPGLNDDIGWQDVHAVCKRLKPHKAAGGDGLPPEFFKLLTADKGVKGNENCPSTSMGKAFLRILRLIFQRAQIPEEAMTAVLVAIPKKGDLTSTDNYRGISLISIAIKILTSIIVQKFQTELESRRFFDKGQAGFRSQQECMGQVVCLKEIVLRRKAAKKPTYVCYIDFQKAYDMVPHEALFAKLEAAGMTGTALEFIKALYNKSQVQVRVGEDMTPPIQVQRGVRQGCPGSPCLFNVFINDILADGDMKGVDVPGLLERIKGLMFTDDLTLLADSPTELQTSLDKTTEWANRWGMKFGIKKCMVTAFFGDMTELRKMTFTLGGETVPIGDSYRYLGMQIDSEFSVKNIIADRAERGQRSLFANLPLLGARALPIWTRMTVFKSCVYPVITYGAEIMGAWDQKLLQKLETIVASGLRIIVGKRTKSTLVATSTLHREFNIPPVSAYCGGQRTRAYEKYAKATTWVGDLVRNVPPKANAVNAKWLWTTRTTKWLRRYLPGTAMKDTREGVWSKWEKQHMGVSIRNYLERNVGRTRGYLLECDRSCTPNRRAETLLLLARIGGLYLADRSLGPAKKICPLCQGTEEGSSLAHLFVCCEEVNTERTKHLAGLFHIVRELLPTGSDLEMSVVLLGGEVGGKGLSEWVALAPHSRIDRAGHVPVMSFLGETIPRYCKALLARRNG